MGILLKVGSDRSASDLRKLARKEDDGKVAARLLAIASAQGRLTRNQAANKPICTVKHWLIGYIGTMLAALKPYATSPRDPQMTFDA